MQRRHFLSALALGSGSAQAIASGIHRVAERIASAPSDRDLWRSIRQEFLFRPGLAHLNAATLGATPRFVLDAIAAMLFELEADPVANVFGPMGYRMEAVRAKAAEMLGATTEEVALTENTTSGMNYVAQALARHCSAGDEILTTTHEHPGGLVCWEYLAKYHGLKIVTVPMPVPVRDKAQILDLIASHMTPRTKI